MRLYDVFAAKNRFATPVGESKYYVRNVVCGGDITHPDPTYIRYHIEMIDKKTHEICWGSPEYFSYNELHAGEWKPYTPKNVPILDRKMGNKSYNWKVKS